MSSDDADALDDEEIPEGLSPFQVEVARRFFALPESAEFLLAGGAALLALHLSRRISRDLDLFTSERSVERALAAFEASATEAGWSVEVVQRSAAFSRLVIGDGEQRQVLLDLGVDAPPRRPPRRTPVGRTYDPEELAGQKLLALFGRAAERDFVDVHVLARRFGTAALMGWAEGLDPGFSPTVLAEMIDHLDRFDDDELPTDEPAELRAFFRGWSAELRG